MLGIRFVKFQPSEYILKYNKGKLVQEGPGLSFFYYSPTTSIASVPISSMEAPFMYEEITSDYQTITIQGQVTYRIVDQKKIIKLLNYQLNNRADTYITEDPNKLPQRIINIIRVLTKKRLGNLTIKEAINASESLAAGILETLRKEEEIEVFGLEILGLQILSILPNKETSRALETKTREEILKQADNAIYVRRNASIEQERIVKENEYNTEIAIENKRRQVKETQIEAERIVQEKENKVLEEQMAFDINLEQKRKELIKLNSENKKMETDSKAYELLAVMKSLEKVDIGIIKALANMNMKPDQLIAMAFQGISDNAEKIGQLNITPDLLNELTRKTETKK